jgi:hypothetical protein
MWPSSGTLGLTITYFISCYSSYTGQCLHIGSALYVLFYVMPYVAERININYFLWVGWDWVHLVRRPLLAYCTSPGWSMVMIMEQSVEWGLAGETEVLGENLPQCPTNPTWPDLG